MCWVEKKRGAARVHAVLQRYLTSGASFLVAALPGFAAGQITPQAPSAGENAECDLVFLPPGPNATTSSAAALALLPDGSACVGGGVQAAGGIWRPRCWIVDGDRPGGAAALSTGQSVGGMVTGAAAHEDGAGDAQIELCGHLIESDGSRLPALWCGRGNSFSLQVLTAPGAGRGSALRVATGDINGDALPDVVACGFGTSVGNPGKQAAVWVNLGGGDDAFTFLPLPSAGGGGECAAEAISFNFDRMLIAGYEYDAQGNRASVMWQLNANGLGVDAIQNIADGTSNTVFALTVGAAQEITVGGSIMAEWGEPQPWLAKLSDGHQADGQVLGLTPGATGGRVNSIIAILIGLLAGGETHGPGGSSAAIWLHAGQVPAAIDLNTLPSNLPAGWRLRNVQQVQQFDEVSEIAIVVGNATTAQGRSIGYVGRLRLDLATAP